MTARGIRNNNPGNIDRTTPRTPWQGQVPTGQLTDPRFEQFIAPQWGIRALAVTLITYQDKHGIRTVEGVIKRYAPSHENNTLAYINFVSERMNVHPSERLDFHDYTTMNKLVRAIMRYEQGVEPPYSEAVINKGLSMAGLVPHPQDPTIQQEKPTPLVATRTIIGTAVSGSAGLAAVGDQLQQAGQSASMLSSPGTWLAIVCAVLIVVGIGLTIYGKMQSRKNGGL